MSISVRMPPKGGSELTGVAATTPGRTWTRLSIWRNSTCLSEARLVLPARQGQAGVQHVADVQAQVHGLQLDEAAHEQAGPRQQHQRQRHLDHHQGAAELAAPAAAAAPFARLAQRLDQVGAGGRSAGTRPNTTGVRTATARLNSSTGRFRRMTASRGISPSGMAAVSSLSPKKASRQPTSAPSSASTRLSTSSCWTSRPRLAPTEARTAISFCRLAARLSSMLATLLQAMSSSSPTAAASV